MGAGAPAQLELAGRAEGTAWLTGAESTDAELARPFSRDLAAPRSHDFARKDCSMKRVVLIQADNRFTADPLIRPLEYAEQDAIALGGFFKHRAGFDQVVTLLAKDDRCILDSATKLCAALDPGDLFVFVASTHGVQVGDHLLLLTSQSNHRPLMARGLRAHTFAPHCVRRTARPPMRQPSTHTSPPFEPYL